MKILRLSAIGIMICLLGFLGIGIKDASAQYREFGVNLFSTHYFGDLTHANNFYYSTRGGVGAHFRRHLTKNISLRADINFAMLSGADNSPRLRRLSEEAFNDTSKYFKGPLTEYFQVDTISRTVTAVRGDVNLRNLSFRSLLSEFSVVAEYKFGEFMINSSVTRANFYLFGGFNVYNFNSQGKSANDTLGWVGLKEITTEGQGLENYYNTKEFRSTQIGIPLGIGVRWTVDKYTRFAAEAGYRILFTDYLDDVSGNYVNPDVIGSVHGQQAAEFVDRTRQLHPWLKPNTLGSARGNTNGLNDGYMFIGLSISRVIYPNDCPRL
ncbi:MAG: hypothetical protein ACKOHH_04705 [Bacteroidota bacterium]